MAICKKTRGYWKWNSVPMPSNGSMGNISGPDSIFEIYTQSYGSKPIVIQGAGAGAEHTARGVFGDVLRIADKIK